MTNRIRNKTLSATAMIFLFFGTSGEVAGQNLTVGDDIGSDHTAYAFAPFRFQADRGESNYRKHVSSGTGTGQQYAFVQYAEAAQPNVNPLQCTVTRFYKIIHDSRTKLGTLLITTHGSDNGIAIEPYRKTAAGKTARDAAFTAYINAGTFTAAQIYKSSTSVSYHISVNDTFIDTHGRLTQGLVYVAACSGGTLTDDFVDGDARVALGNDDCPTAAAQKTRVTTFFKRMDGKQGQAKRPVSAAKVGLSLDTSGLENTTLAPSVLTLTAPCPIKAGDIVEITLDTRCEVGITPDIVGVGCTIEMETWVNGKTLRGTCTAPPPPGVFNFDIILKWPLTYSDQNVARLDGNTNKPGKNAEGPAHDDYVKSFRCAPTEPDCEGSKGDCCDAAGNGTPGCNDVECCSLVCQNDPLCCVVWDSLCAETAVQSCAICSVDLCADPNSGDCCTPGGNGSPSCDDPACCQLLCNLDPFCCDTTWDSFCAVAAAQLCEVCGGCGSPDAGDCGEANGSPGCDDNSCCVVVCLQNPFCCQDAWDLSCAAMALEICAGGQTCPGDGDCFQPNFTPGCDEPECCEAVCVTQPFCCDMQWDDICAGQAQKICQVGPVACGDPAAGSCFQDNGTAACDNADCCISVCNNDPQCCDLVWDQVCADQANDLCGPPVACDGDLNGDGVVAIQDLLALLAAWGPCDDECPLDIDGDNQIGITDLLLLLGQWGPCS